MAGKLLTTGEAARLCAVTPDTVRKWIRSGRLPAQCTAGGHHRIDRRDLEKVLRPALSLSRQGQGPSSPFSYCWEFYAVDGQLQLTCSNCIIFKTRAQRCYEISGANRWLDDCQESCHDCDYHQAVHHQDTNVLIISDDQVLTEALKRNAQNLPFNVEIANCDHLQKVASFLPDFVFVDCGLSPDECRHIREHLTDDGRLPLVRFVVATSGGKFPTQCTADVLAVLKKPFSISEIIACLGEIPTDGLSENQWISGALAP